MERNNISSGSTFEKKIGYSRAVEIDDWVVVSGTTGYDYSTMLISDNVAEQAEQTISNIELALSEANCTLNNVVKVTYIFPDSNDFEKCWKVLSSKFGKILPAATMISAGLADKKMKIEIEVWAKK